MNIITRLAKGFGRFVQAVQGVAESDKSLFVRLVLGRNEHGFSADVYDRHGEVLAAITEIRLVGPSGMRTLKSMEKPAPENECCSDGLKSLSKQERWSRNVAWMGEQGQKALAGTKLGIVGAGGLGNLIIHFALGLGFRHFTLVDPDRVEISNLNRLIGVQPADVGKHKVQALASAVLRQYPGAEIMPLPICVEDPAALEALLQCDFLVAGVDDDEARLTTQNLAVRHLKPLLDMGAGFSLEEDGRVKRMGGQASLYIPGGPCLICQGLDPARIVPRASRIAQQATGYVVGTPLTPAAAVTLNAAVASVGMDMFVRYLTGFAAFPSYLAIDLLRHRTQTMEFSKRKDCPLCGQNGLEGVGAGRATPRPPKEKRKAEVKGIWRLSRF